MAVVRELVAKFGIDFDGKGLKEADKGLASLKTASIAAGAAIAAAAAAAGVALFNMAQDMATVGDDAAKTAKQLDFGVEALQLWQFAAKRSGATAQEFNNSVRKLQRSVFDADRGLKEQKDAFDALGVSVRATDGSLKDTEVLLQETAVALGDLEDKTLASGLAQTIFGRSGTKLLPLFNEQEKGMQALINRGKELGVITAAQTEAAEADVDAMLDQETAILALKAVIADQLLPSMTEFTTALANQIAEIKNWLNEGDNLEQTIDTVQKLFIGAATIAIPLMTVALGALAKAAFLAALPFAPIILLLGLLVAIIGTVIANWDDFVFVFKEGVKAAKAVLEVFAKAFGDLFESMFGADALDTVKSFFSGMLDAADKAFDRIVGGAKRVAKALGFGGPVDDTGIGRGSVRGLANQSTQPVEPTGESLQSRIIEGAQSVSRVAEFMGVGASQSTPQNMSVSPPGSVSNSSSVDNSDNRVNAEITINGAQSPERTGEAVANAIAQSKKASNRRTRNQFRQTAPT